MKIKNIIIGFSCTFVLVICLIFGSFMFLHSVNKDIVSSKPDTSEWTLSNEKFVIVPKIDETVTFCIENKYKETVFISEKEWRSWDFKSLNIDKDSNITISTSDMGDEYYFYNGETWIYNSANSTEKSNYEAVDDVEREIESQKCAKRLL